MALCELLPQNKAQLDQQLQDLLRTNIVPRTIAFFQSLGRTLDSVGLEFKTLIDILSTGVGPLTDYDSNLVLANKTRASAYLNSMIESYNVYVPYFIRFAQTFGVPVTGLKPSLGSYPYDPQQQFVPLDKTDGSFEKASSQTAGILDIRKNPARAWLTMADSLKIVYQQVQKLYRILIEEQFREYGSLEVTYEFYKLAEVKVLSGLTKASWAFQFARACPAAVKEATNDVQTTGTFDWPIEKISMAFYNFFTKFMSQSTLEANLLEFGASMQAKMSILNEAVQIQVPGSTYELSRNDVPNSMPWKAFVGYQKPMDADQIATVSRQLALGLKNPANLAKPFIPKNADEIETITQIIQKDFKALNTILQSEEKIRDQRELERKQKFEAADKAILQEKTEAQAKADATAKLAQEQAEAAAAKAKADADEAQARADAAAKLAQEQAEAAAAKAKADADEARAQADAAAKLAQEQADAALKAEEVRRRREELASELRTF